MFWRTHTELLLTWVARPSFAGAQGWMVDYYWKLRIQTNLEHCSETALKWKENVKVSKDTVWEEKGKQSREGKKCIICIKLPDAMKTLYFLSFGVPTSGSPNMWEELAPLCFSHCCGEDLSEYLQFNHPRFPIYKTLGWPYSPEEPGAVKLIFEAELTR